MADGTLQLDSAPVPSLPRPLSSAPILSAMPAALSAPAPVRSALKKQPANLHTLHQDVLYHIILRLDDMGASLRPLSLTSWRLNRLIHAIRLKGRLALPIRLPVPSAGPRGLAIQRASRRITLRKTDAPGDAFVVFRRDITQTSAMFHFRVDRLAGHRLDIGLATAAAFRFGTVERASSWSFDCFGRASLAGRRITYGRQMRAGDVVSVLFDARARTLSFLDNGLSMGALPLADASGRPVAPGQPLFAFAYFPSRAGEALTILRERRRSVVDLRHVHASVARWRRPAGLPCDGCVVVSTWEERTWYAIRLNPRRDTMRTLWQAVQERHGMAMNLFELIYEGRRLQCSDRTLHQDGIIMDERTGTCSSDVLLSVPHIIS